MINEASGKTLSREGKAKARVHHITITPSSTEEKPANWVASHFKSEHHRSPERHHFSDGVELLRHLGNSLGVPAPDDGESE